MSKNEITRSLAIENEREERYAVDVEQRKVIQLR